MNDEVDEYLIQKRVEAFTRKYQPRGYESEFAADLHMLLRAVHADAAKPYAAMAENIMKNMVPLMAFTPTPLKSM